MKRGFHLLLAIGFAVVLRSSPAARGQPADGPELQRATALESLKKMGMAGDVVAQYNLGVLYRSGNGVPKDAAEALKWFRLAAEQGYSSAQYNLGTMLYKGEGAPQDFAEAFKWLRLAAEAGEARAQFNLGAMYSNGEGVPEDPAEAAKWLRLAAEQGFAAAQIKLGIMYRIGRGVPEDAAEAISWFRRAAEKDSAEAQFHLGTMLYEGEGVPKDVPQAVEWYRRAAEQGHAKAQNNYANSFLKGESVPVDSTEAAKWYRRAADNGNPQSQFMLAMLLANGEGVPKNASEALTWFQRAAEQGHAKAQFELSTALSRGEGVTKDVVQAFAWATLSVRGGYTQATARREMLSKEMTREQIAEAQRIAAEFKPKVWKADEAEKSPVAAPRLDVTGAGFFITPDGCFVTNHHVVADATSIRVRTATGTFPATVVRTDPTNDFAILKVAGEFSALAVRGSPGVKVADRVATLEFPNPELQGEAAKYASGEIAALSGPADDPRFLQISVPIQPGNSGGPLVDSSGAVVGVVVSQLDKVATLKLTGNIPENVNYAIKGTILLGVLESVPGLAEKVRTEPEKPATDAAEVARTLEAACGLVLVEK